MSDEINKLRAAGLGRQFGTFQKIGDDGSFAGTMSITKEETIESLLEEVLKLSYENEEASRALRDNFIGPQPEAALDGSQRHDPPIGLVNMLKHRLRIIISQQHTVRANIANISREVR